MKNNGVAYNHIISLKNIHEAWREFVSGKKYKKDVAEFLLKLSENTYKLHTDLKNKTYIHGSYEAFAVNDPKPRSIHKASVRDRLLHHTLYRKLYPYFDQKFIYDSYSCRDSKGTHRALDRFMQFARKVSRSNKRTCWVLKCDVRKFFASIDHSTLMTIIKKHISDADVISLVDEVVNSFQSIGPGKGLPLGNLTSQLLVNVYMNEFDQYIKHVLKEKFYIRYADDFVIMNCDRNALIDVLQKIHVSLESVLKLQLHLDKVSIETVSSGIDFLGWVHFPTHRVLRTSTKRRMLKNLQNKPKPATTASYRGMLKHGNTHKLQQKLFKYDTLNPL